MFLRSSGSVFHGARKKIVGVAYIKESGYQTTTVCTWLVVAAGLARPHLQRCWSNLARKCTKCGPVIIILEC